MLVRNRKGVSRCANACYRSTRLHVVNDVFHLCIRKVAESQLQYEQVGIVDQGETRDVCSVFWVDFTGYGVLAEQHKGLKPVRREHSRQHRQALFRAVFFVAGHKHNSPPSPWSQVWIAWV